MGGASSGNDIWGWTDPLDGKEYALMGTTSGTAFIDVTTPEFPVYLGFLNTHTSNSTWRDIKVYSNHAFIVSEAGGHGMQVFDLTRLRNVINPPVSFTEDAHYSGFGNAHNIVINEDSGFAYGVGTNTQSGGLHFVNISNPTSPVSGGSGFSQDGYTHDAQAIIYNGPDTDYVGSEIVFAANEDTFTIVDVTDKTDATQVARVGYPGSAYTHQGWATEDHRFYLMDDELDEAQQGINTRTYIWNIENLDNPFIVGTYTSSIAAIDHNLYTKDNKAYQANYRGGMRVLDLANISSGNLTEVGYFDVYPTSNSANFNGAWSVYPYFPSGTIVISSIEDGLFVVKESAPVTCPSPSALSLVSVVGSSFDITWQENGSADLWDIAIIEEGTSFTGIPTVNDISSSTYTFTADASGTTYLGYVRADCDGAAGNDESGWTGPLSLTVPADYCSGDLFTDSGGSNGTYQDNEDESYLLCPSGQNEVVQLEFTLVDIEVNAFSESIEGGCWDFMSIYDGPDVSSPVLASPRCGELDGDGQTPFVPSSLLQAGDLFISTHPTGCLTVTFQSDGSVVEQGWEATVTCLPNGEECQAPTDLEVIEIGFGTSNPRVNATWNNTEGTTDCEVKGGRISNGTAGTSNPQFANPLNTKIVSQTNGSTVNFNIALYNNPNINFVQGNTYGYEVRCQCADGSGFSPWSGITPQSTFIVPFAPAGMNAGNKAGSVGMNELTLYPNPVTADQLNWSLSYAYEDEQTELRILDALGRTVHVERVKGMQGTVELTALELENGIYLLQIQNDEFNSTARFIKE
jgi:choice-of-anchor B domain-containing protein